MNVSVRSALSLIAIIAALTLPLVAHTQDDVQPKFIKAKFDMPLDHKAIKQKWVRLGYGYCEIIGKSKGWMKGEHTHIWHALFAGLSGNMEFIINDKRFVLEAGDELYYPKNAVNSARNLYDGRSEWFACFKS